MAIWIHLKTKGHRLGTERLFSDSPQVLNTEHIVLAAIAGRIGKTNTYSWSTSVPNSAFFGVCQNELALWHIDEHNNRTKLLHGGGIYVSSLAWSPKDRLLYATGDLSDSQRTALYSFDLEKEKPTPSVIFAPDHAVVVGILDISRTDGRICLLLHDMDKGQDIVAISPASGHIWKDDPIPTGFRPAQYSWKKNQLLCLKNQKIIGFSPDLEIEVLTPKDLFLSPPGPEMLSFSDASSSASLDRHDYVYHLNLKSLKLQLAGHGYESSISPDGQHVAFVNNESELRIWHFSTGDTESVIYNKEENQCNLEAWNSERPVWSANSKLVAFSLHLTSCAQEDIAFAGFVNIEGRQVTITEGEWSCLTFTS